MDKNILKDRIEQCYALTVKDMKTLEILIHDLGNIMYECHCDDRVAFDFRNISTELGSHILCVNCGGTCDPKDFEDCGIF